MAQILYPSYNIREKYCLPTDLADPYLLENTLKTVSNKYGSVYMYDSDMNGIVQYTDAIERMKNTFIGSGKNDTITVWHDILKIPRSGIYNIRDKRLYVLDRIIKDYVDCFYKTGYNKYQVVSSILRNNQMDSVVILTICTMSYNTHIPLDISEYTLYPKALALNQIISNNIGKLHNVGYLKPEGVSYSYNDYKDPNMKDVIIFMG